MRHENSRKPLRQSCSDRLSLDQEALPRYSHPKSPHHFTLPQLAACVLLMYYLDFSYRDMEEWLLATDQVSQALELPRIPDHTTLQRTYKKLHMLDFEKMKNQLLDENGVEEEGIASDSTGFSPGQASLYYQTRTGRIYQRWAKGVYAVGTASQFILAWRSGWGRAAMWLICLGRGDVRRYGRYQGKRKAWVMMAMRALMVDPFETMIWSSGATWRQRAQPRAQGGGRFGFSGVAGWSVWSALED